MTFANTCGTDNRSCQTTGLRQNLRNLVLVVQASMDRRVVNTTFRALSFVRTVLSLDTIVLDFVILCWELIMSV